MHDLSLEAKVGQMMMFGFPERKYPTTSASLSRSTTRGNYHLSRNVQSPVQITELNSKLQELALAVRLELGCLLPWTKKGPRCSHH